MNQSGKSIQSKSLNRVLGNLNNIHVQPYKVFVKEEQKKLHEHWLVRFSELSFCYIVIIEHFSFLNLSSSLLIRIYFIFVGCNWWSKTSLWHMRTGCRDRYKEMQWGILWWKRWRENQLQSLRFVVVLFPSVSPS
jgi:hypothetical protein